LVQGGSAGEWPVAEGRQICGMGDRGRGKSDTSIRRIDLFFKKRKKVLPNLLGARGDREGLGVKTPGNRPKFGKLKRSPAGLKYRREGR